MDDLHDPDLARLLRLDAEPGPAPPQSAAAEAAMISAAVSTALGPGGGGGPGGAALKLAALTAALALALTGAWLLTRSGAAPEPRVSEKVVTPVSDTPEAPGRPDAGQRIEEPETELVMEAETVPEPAPKKPPPKKLAPASSEDLLAEANAARKRKAWKEADALYARVVDEHAGTAAAQIALVASATLHLEHLEDPRGAVKRFQKALAGPVAEEARYGLAEAYRALGDDAAEAAALTDFLRHHPDSPLAERARKRRAQLP